MVVRIYALIFVLLCATNSPYIVDLWNLFLVLIGWLIDSWMSMDQLESIRQIFVRFNSEYYWTSLHVSDDNEVIIPILFLSSLPCKIYAVLQASLVFKERYNACDRVLNRICA